PALEGAMKAGGLRKPQQEGDLRELQVFAAHVAQRETLAQILEQGAESRALALQLALQGARAHAKARSDVSDAGIAACELVHDRASHTFGELTGARQLSQHLLGVFEDHVVQPRVGAAELGGQEFRIEDVTAERRPELERSRTERQSVLAGVFRLRLRKPN